MTDAADRPSTDDSVTEDAATDPGLGPPSGGDAWPRDDDPLDDGWTDWEDAPARARPASRIEWSALEVESFDVLPKGRVRAGRRERLAVDGLPGGPVEALLDTGAATSCLRATTVAGGDLLTVRLPDREVAVRARRQDDAWVLDATVLLGAHKQGVTLALAPAAPGEPPLLLGVDALAGLVVVDPAESHLLGGTP